MKRVGVRDLKDNLSRYLRAVADGETILVTDRGRVVAEVRPASVPDLGEDSEDARMQKLIREGRARPPRDPRRLKISELIGSGPYSPEGTTAAGLDWDRDDQRLSRLGRRPDEDASRD